MAISFRGVFSAPLQGIDATAPDGAVIGIIGDNGAGKSALLRLAAGRVQPTTGSVKASGEVRMLGPDDPLSLDSIPVLLIEHTFARQDPVVRERACIAIDQMRRGGSTTLLVSHEEPLLRRLCDEIWWLHEGKLAGRGDPEEMLAAYGKHVAGRIRDWGETVSVPVSARVRRGDGRAEIVGITTVGENGRPTMVWRSGELAVIRVQVRFRDAVADPVVGIMIRTRIGLNVYGSNTELEKLKLGPCAAGAVLELAFAFRCELCPQEYTLTVASHDPDGVWHDWLEDAVAFSVSDTRYTAGVANLRATVSLLSRT
jgi:ABC-type sulfate/molybdate transport systems ATPase subunit